MTETTSPEQFAGVGLEEICLDEFVISTQKYITGEKELESITVTHMGYMETQTRIRLGKESFPALRDRMIRELKTIIEYKHDPIPENPETQEMQK